jgi:uncharacterized protein (TIGR02246 family)
MIRVRAASAAAFVCLLTAVLVAMASGVHAQDKSDESQIRAIVAAQATAWNAGDGNAYAKDVAPDVSFTNLFGMVMYGAPAFAERHRQILATFYNGTTKQHEIRRIRFVTSDVAIVDIDNSLRGVKAMPAGIAVPPDGTLKTQLMEVFVRRSGRWWIEAYHNVDAKADKPDFSGEWILNRQASTLSPGADGVKSAVVRIEHRSTFRYQATFETAGNPLKVEYELQSDGREVAAGQPGAQSVSSLRWDGSALIYTGRIQRPNGELQIEFRYELFDDGRRLRAVEKLRGGGREQDNVWIFERR